jgi:hypothetical protein
MLSIYRLPNKLPGEKIIKVARKHFFLLFKKILFLLLLMALPVAFFYVFILSNSSLMQMPETYPVIVLFASAFYLFIWLFFFFSFIDYYLDAWIITSERIINMEQDGFFSRTISEEKLFRVQDVTSEVKGFFPTVLGYGHVFVQTAGTKEYFHFENVSSPDKIRDMIIKLADGKKSEAFKDEKSNL